MAASTAFGRLISNPVRNSRQMANVIEQITSASRVRAGLVIDRGLRQAACDGVALAQRDGEIGCAQTKNSSYLRA